MKFTIERHRELLVHRERHLKDQERRLAMLQDEVDRYRRDVLMYRQQIERAEREGRTGFDEERYGKRRVVS